MRNISPSFAQVIMDCPRKGVYHILAPLPKAVIQHAAGARTGGKQAHAWLEAYFKDEPLPEIPAELEAPAQHARAVVEAGLQRSEDIYVEAMYSAKLGGLNVRAVADLVAVAPGRVLVHDFKFKNRVTKKGKTMNVMSEREALWNVQVLMTALGACEATGAEEVTARWIYSCLKSPKTHCTEVTVSRVHAEKTLLSFGLEEKLERTLKAKHSLTLLPRITETEPRSTACERCDWRVLCVADAKEWTEEAILAYFLERMYKAPTEEEMKAFRKIAAENGTDLAEKRGVNPEPSPPQPEPEAPEEETEDEVVQAPNTPALLPTPKAKAKPAPKGAEPVPTLTRLPFRQLGAFIELDLGGAYVTRVHSSDGNETFVTLVIPSVAF